MAQFLFLVYWLLKSFYISKSGGLQIADYIFCVSFIALFIEHIGKIKKGQFIILIEQDKPFIIFVFLSAIINLIYWIFYGDNRLLLSIAYFIFNLLVVVAFRLLAEKRNFIKNFFMTTFLCIAIQLIIYFLGQGRWYAEERYMGTFNDPNQLAFFIMSRFFILYIIYNHLKRKNFIKKAIVFFAFCMTIFLIIQSASTGMLLGMGIFVISWLIYSFFSLKAILKYVLVLSGVFVVILLLLINEFEALNISIAESNFIFDRLKGKIEEMSGQNGFAGFIEDRNLQAFFNAPYYMLFGIGEGAFNRFIALGSAGDELHSSVLGLLFYYGLIPCFFLLKWAKNNLKNKTKADICVYLALFVEMLTLINHRQASLWLILILPSVLFQMDMNKNAKNILIEKKGE